MANLTSYDNLGGKGDRRGIINITTNASFNGLISNFLDGNKTSQNLFLTTQSAQGKYIQFEFQTPVKIDEITWIQQYDSVHGTWKIQGSENGTTWKDIGDTFILGGSPNQQITSINSNYSFYKFYRMFGLSGTTSIGPYLFEIEFKLTDVMTTLKHLIKSSNQIHILGEDKLVYPNIQEPISQEQFEKWGMDSLGRYSNSISKVSHEMVDGGILEDGRVVRKTINKNDFIINSLEVK